MMHIFSMKGKTKKMMIQSVEDAPILYIPLHKYYGSQPEPIVKAGDKVKKYQLLARSINDMPANMHSPVSGTVVEVKDLPQPDGLLVATIIITNDFREEEIAPSINIPESSYTVEQLIELIGDAGIVGEGGAQFPTSLKYRLDGRTINTFIINGTECEPYLTADYALMAERTEQLFKGIAIANRIIQAPDVVISIERQNKELQKVFAPYLQKEEYKNCRIVILPNEYPQGGELQLIKSVTGIEMPRAQRPRDIGVIVSNVGTICAIYNAVVEQRPVISRIMTFSGATPVKGNFEVKIGTPVSHLINKLGISTTNKTVVLGGPMMGKNASDLSIPVSKGSSGVLLFQKENIKRNNCISCGYCVEVCPMHLMPMKFEENFRQKKYFNLEKYSISSCIECAACEYICPSNVPLIESIKEGKMKLKELANAIQ